MRIVTQLYAKLNCQVITVTDVHVCVFMRQANAAVVRERHPIPTVEEILQDLNGSTVFSKLDLKWGFHQIVLDEECRHITTFVTHRGLYQYKRLMFGISSAPEKYNIIWNVVMHCPGVKNVADDLVVHSSSQEVHDRNLEIVLKCLQEVGLALNWEKCEFDMSKLAFFGHEITSDGVNPSDEKIEAILNAEPPRDVKEVHSFMDLVQYSAKFLPDLATMSVDVERRCSQTEREALALVWACEHFNLIFSS